jgi:hypothetical protein
MYHTLIRGKFECVAPPILPSAGSRTILWWWRFEQDVRFQRLAGHN